MRDRPEKDRVMTAFRQECSIRRTARLLQGKRDRIREDLRQLISHMALLVPPVPGATRGTDPPTEVLTEALNRLGDDAFAQLVLQILQEIQPY
ncbi:MAG: hypothetical protein F6J93_00310 [Oscillatoria sp. SIO1A7]|nr:hypothetical protein [Oscillatoria sp. SIO1A7]